MDSPGRPTLSQEMSFSSPKLPNQASRELKCMQNSMHRWEDSFLQPNPMNPTKEKNLCQALSLPILNTHIFGPGWNWLAFKC